MPPTSVLGVQSRRLHPNCYETASLLLRFGRNAAHMTDYTFYIHSSPILGRVSMHFMSALPEFHRPCRDTVYGSQKYIVKHSHSR